MVESNGLSCKAISHEQCHCSRGKVVGGTGAINGMMYVPGTRFDYDRWQELGNIGWGYDDVKPYFEKSVKPAGNDTHPLGYVALNKFPVFDGDVDTMMFQGAQELGLNIVEEFKEGNYLGYGRVKGTIENGRRLSTLEGHLGRVSYRPNLHIIKNAHVTKLDFDMSAQKVTAVEFLLREEYKLKVEVTKEAIISAGSLNSPKILMLSGIGPEDHLQSFNIPVVKNLAIGQNLQDHVLINVYMRLPGTPLNETLVLDAIYEYLIHKTGPLASHGTTSLTGFINTNISQASEYPNVEMHHFIIRRGDMLGLETYLNGVHTRQDLRAYFKDIVNNYDMLGICVLIGHPKSRGNIQLKSESPLQPPIINGNYLSMESDIEVLLEAMKHLMRLEQTQAFKEKQVEIVHIPLAECDQHEFKSDEYWRCYLTYFSGACYHPAGTVKMGPEQDEQACVDSRLRVKGIDNLRVIDASIMPYITSSITNAPTIMIAEKGADLIKEDWNELA